MKQKGDMANRTAPALFAREPGAVIRRNGDELELVNLHWGLRPKEEDGAPFTAIRSEGREFPSHRCLLPASEFIINRRKERWRFSLADGDHFYIAGIWRPWNRGWPESYAVLTTWANDDVVEYRERQVAIILRADRYAWLDHAAPEGELLKPLPAGTFKAEREDAPLLAI